MRPLGTDCPTGRLRKVRLTQQPQTVDTKRGQTIYRQTGQTAPSVRYTSTIGEGYRGTQDFTTQQAKVIFRGSEHNIITAFPE